MAELSLAENLSRFKIIPVLVLNDVESGLKRCEMLLKNGLGVAEITFRTEAAETQGEEILLENLNDGIAAQCTLVIVDQLSGVYSVRGLDLLYHGLSSDGAEGEIGVLGGVHRTVESDADDDFFLAHFGDGVAVGIKHFNADDIRPEERCIS